MRPSNSVHATRCRGAPLHRRLVRLRWRVRIQQRGVGALRECRERVQELPIGRRPDRGYQQSPSRLDLLGVQPFRPRNHRSTGGHDHPRALGRADGTQQLPLGNLPPSTPERRSGHGTAVRSYCDTTGFDNRGWPMTFAAPGGTTRLEQLIICGAAQCLPGATMHAQILEVTVDDPIPPSISLDGPLASGQWVSGRGAEPNVVVAAQDNAGVRDVTASVGPQAQSESYPCTFAQARPCSDQTTQLTVPIGDLPDGRHSLTVSATDAAGNSSAAARDVYVDNTAPDPVAPASDRWRRVATHQPFWHCMDQSSGPRRSNHSSSLEDLHDRWELPFKRSARRHKYSGVAIAQSAGAR